MARTLKVGIIGASPNRGWAAISHVPAVQGTDGLELHAVVTQDQASAEEAAKKYGAARAYGDAGQLFEDPDVDIVTVAVNVPAHRELVLGAARAGKHLYCEYPLGRDVAEAEALAEAVRTSGVHCAIGLQSRMNPATVEAGRRLRSGEIGRILSVRVHSTTMAFGPKVEAAMAFAEDDAKGVTLATIQGSHTLDLVEALLGQVQDPAVRLSTQFPEVEVEGKGRQPRSTFDHLLLIGRVQGGAPVSIEVAGGRAADDTPFLLEIVGETGVLRLEGGAPRGFQSGPLALKVDGAVRQTPPPPVSEPVTALNVSCIYAALRDDILSGGHSAPGLDEAVAAQRHAAQFLARA